jgi:hypothetical protein
MLIATHDSETGIFVKNQIIWGRIKGKNDEQLQYKDKIEEVITDRDRIIKSLAEGVKDALKLHKVAGNPLVVMKDGHMV